MDDPVGYELKLLCVIAQKYEPDLTAILADYEDTYSGHIQRQTAYNVLERLDKADYVEKKALDGKSNCYMITQKGAERLLELRENVLTATRDLR